MKTDDLFELIASISAETNLQDGHKRLREALATYGLDHAVYAAINIPTAKRDRPLIAVTYEPDWQRRYAQKGYIDIDPVVKAGLGGILPVDWATLDRSETHIKHFFGEASEMHVGNNGLSFPVRGRLREFALFSITTQMKGPEWAKLRENFMREFMLLAYHFHSFALRVEGVDQDDYTGKLTPREKECLRWRALGKSDWDTAHIMGLSERTVKFHLENARAKLGAQNTIHATSKAIALGLINLA